MAWRKFKVHISCNPPSVFQSLSFIIIFLTIAHSFNGFFSHFPALAEQPQKTHVWKWRDKFTAVSKICIFIAKLILKIIDQETNKHFPEFEYLVGVYTLPDKEKRGGKKKHDRYEKFKPSSSRYPWKKKKKEKRTSHIIQTPLHLWNYEIPGIIQNHLNK